MPKRLVILWCLWFTGLLSYGQDPHFAQYNASPLYLNPALTGVFDPGYKEQNIRVSSVYRQQWRSIPSGYVSAPTPFSTTYIAADGVITAPRLLGKDYVGVGLMLFKDNSGDLGLVTQQMLLSMSYNLSLNHRANEYISLGGQYGFSQRSIDPSLAAFDSQWNGQAYDPSLPTNENFTGNKYTFQDASAGIAYHYFPRSKMKISAGMALAHLNRPSYSFLSGPGFTTLPMKMTAHGNLVIPLKNGLEYMPGLLVLRQSTATEVTTTQLVRVYPKNMGRTFYQGGLGFRLVGSYTQFAASDAVVALVGMRYEKWQIGFSYDVNVSGLSTASNYQGAFEISLVYHDIIGTHKRRMAGKSIKNINECPDTIEFGELPH